MKKILVLPLLLSVLSLSGCFMFSGREEAAPPPNPVVSMEVEGLGTITIELYPQIAPNTVANFVTLVQQGYYDGLSFHRVIPGFMVQGGDPTGTGTGGPGYTIKGEFRENGVENGLSHGRGVISMARRNSDMDSAGSQFFIMHADAPYLDGQYAAFGKVTDEEGMKVIDLIANTPTDTADKPVVERKILKVTVDTKGYQYEVVKIED